MRVMSLVVNVDFYIRFFKCLEKIRNRIIVIFISMLHDSYLRITGTERERENDRALLLILSVGFVNPDNDAMRSYFNDEQRIFIVPSTV